MYVLIRVGTNDSMSIEFVPKTKNKLVGKIKESRRAGQYVLT